MKKILNIFFVFMVIIAISCSKTEISKNTTTKKPVPFKFQSAPSNWIVWNGVNACVAPPVNCLPYVTITTKPKEALESAIDSGTAAIGRYFSGDNYSYFASVLDSNYFNTKTKLKSGTYNLLEVTNGNIHYFLAHQLTVSIDTPEFVLTTNVIE